LIRFRHQDDERRWTSLRAQIYLRLATYLPHPMLAKAMQNLYKLEELLLLEGVRQGVACQTLAELMKNGGSDLDGLRPFQLHAHVYGSQDTPLRTVELERLERLGLPTSTGESSTLDDKPMRFAPAPRADDPPLDRVMSRLEKTGGSVNDGLGSIPSTIFGSTDSGPVLLDLSDDPVLAALDRAPFDEEPDSAEEMRQKLETLRQQREDAEHESHLDAVFSIEAGEGDPRYDPIPLESPDTIDRIRDTIQHLRAGGWTPTSWTELVLRLHMLMHIDAAYLDLELSTEMGRAVLDQCGLFEIQPGYATSYAPDDGG
jgi:hypothetical protein